MSQLPQSVQNAIDSAVGFIPSIIGAIVILIVGWIIGRILGGVVTRVLREIGISQYARGTPLESDNGADIAQSVGEVLKYIVYFYAFLAAANVLGIAILSQLLSKIGAFLPLILGALILLVIGFIVGRIVGDLVGEIVDGFGFGSFLRGTPLEAPIQSVGGAGPAVGKIVEYYIYFFALLAASQALQIDALSNLLNTFAGYIPTLIAGLLILVVGIFVADFIGNLISDIDTSRLTDYVGIIVQIFIYYITATIALQTVGFGVSVLTTLFQTVVVAFFGALAVAAAIGAGIGIGWGSKDYVAENIDGWMASARSSAASLEEESDTGSDDEFDSPGSTDD